MAVSCIQIVVAGAGIKAIMNKKGWFIRDAGDHCHVWRLHAGLPGVPTVLAPCQTGTLQHYKMIPTSGRRSQVDTAVDMSLQSR